MRPYETQYVDDEYGDDNTKCAELNVEMYGGTSRIVSQEAAREYYRTIRKMDAKMHKRKDKEYEAVNDVLDQGKRMDRWLQKGQEELIAEYNKTRAEEDASWKRIERLYSDDRGGIAKAYREAATTANKKASNLEWSINEAKKLVNTAKRENDPKAEIYEAEYRKYLGHHKWYKLQEEANLVKLGDCYVTWWPNLVALYGMPRIQ